VSQPTKSKAQSNRTRRGNTSSDDPVTAWAEAVVAGRIVAGPHVRNACRRHLGDLVEGPKRGLTWDLEAAWRAINFFTDVLRLNGGQFEGLPFALQPSQIFKTGCIFGWKRRDGSRRFRRAYMEEGKGNGKSPWAAGTGMYCLLADGEARAEVYAAASKRDQAMVLFRDAVAMYQQSPALFERLDKSGGDVAPWNLADLQSNSFFRPLASDDSQSGPRPSCALLDEIHEHKDGNMIEMLERGFKWRRQPLLVMITNSGSDRQSACFQEHQHAVRVAAGTMTPDDDFTYVGEAIDDAAFSFVCSLDKDDDPLEDPDCWVKTNPLLGVTVQPDYLRDVVAQAKAIPGKLNNILRLHFCVWTDADTAWMSRSALDAVLADFEPSVEHQGKKVYLGLDLSATRDLTALAFVVPTGFKTVERKDPQSGLIRVVQAPTYDAWVEAWTPADTITERALSDQAPYDVWARQGWLTATPGKVVRYDFIAARIAEAQYEFDPKALAFDAYAFRKLFIPELDAGGVQIEVVEHPQGGTRRAKESGLWMPSSVRLLEEMILEARIRILRSPVTIAAIMAVTTETDAFDNKWLSKRKSVNRIDCAVALAMAVGCAHANAGNSPYEKRGLLVLG
jgi:phage terminase large subunit-like protein